jgi:hypothetical protein
MMITRAYTTLTYLLTPCRRVLLEKLTGSQLVKKFPAFYENRRFITTFTNPATCPYPQPARYSPCILPTTWRSNLILSSHRRFGLPSSLFPSCFLTIILYVPLLTPIYPACKAHAPYYIVICGLSSSVACLVLPDFSTLSHKRHDFREKTLSNVKFVFWFSLQCLPEIFLIPGLVQHDAIKNVQRCWCKVPTIISRIWITFNFLDRFFGKHFFLKSV